MKKLLSVLLILSVLTALFIAVPIASEAKDVNTIACGDADTASDTEPVTEVPTQLTETESATETPDQPTETEPVETQPAATEPAEDLTNMDVIYFDASSWKNANKIFCHIWVLGGESFFPWHSNKEACKKLGDGRFYYDLANLDNSTAIKGGLKSSTDYCLIFSSSVGAQTYDTTFGTACIGDTVVPTSNNIENPLDSEKTAVEAVWTKNSSKFGPHLTISSTGNIIGSKLCPNEKITVVIGNWLINYYDSKYVNAVDALAKAFPKFGIKTSAQIQAIMDYIVSKETGENEKAMSKILSSAFEKVYPKSANPVKVTAKKSVTAKAKKKTTIKNAIVVKKAQGKVTYKTNNKKIIVKNASLIVAKGFKKGKTIRVNVTVTVKGNSKYKSKTIVKTIKIKIK